VISIVSLSVANGRAATYEAISSAQEVFQCPHPHWMDFNFLNSSSVVKITLVVGSDNTPIPYLAIYSPTCTPVQDNKMTSQSLICACTMVFNVAKFLN
jgi:hypothetical protein